MWGRTTGGGGPPSVHNTATATAAGSCTGKGSLALAANNDGMTAVIMSKHHHGSAGVEGGGQLEVIVPGPLPIGSPRSRGTVSSPKHSPTNGTGGGPGTVTVNLRASRSPKARAGGSKPNTPTNGGTDAQPRAPAMTVDAAVVVLASEHAFTDAVCAFPAILRGPVVDPPALVLPASSSTESATQPTSNSEARCSPATAEAPAVGTATGDESHTVDETRYCVPLVRALRVAVSCVIAWLSVHPLALAHWPVVESHALCLLGCQRCVHFSHPLID